MSIKIYPSEILELTACGVPIISERTITIRTPPLVYIAGPFSATTREGVEANVRRAERTGLVVASLGGMPVIPHSNTGAREFEHAQPYVFWIAGTLALMRRCDAVVMTLRWDESPGARGERDEALRLGIPVFNSPNPEFRQWLKDWQLSA